jgi:hypothetical protein
MPKLVDVESLAAALHDVANSPPYAHPIWTDCGQRHDEDAAAILAAIPPDPRLDALLEAARQVTDTWDAMPEDDGFDPSSSAEAALREALAAFGEK